jgi:hypothetical protein
VAEGAPNRPQHAAPGRMAVPLRVVQSRHHQAPADLRAIIAVGRGDTPLKDLKFRCRCGSRLTDAVVMARDTLRVQPWRAEGEDSTSSAAGHLRGQRHGG